MMSPTDVLTESCGLVGLAPPALREMAPTVPTMAEEKNSIDDGESFIVLGSGGRIDGYI
jgi:hypothetical protein